MLTFTFFGADAFVTLSINAVRHHSTATASVAVTGATLGWTVGAWLQARLNDRWESRRLVRVGIVTVLVGIAGMIVVLDPALAIGVALAAWTVGGLGMGLAYAPTSLMMFREAPPGREGWASSSLALADALGIALGTGLGGAAVAAAVSAGQPLRTGVTAAFGVAMVGGIAAILLSGGLPLRALAREGRSPQR